MLIVISPAKTLDYATPLKTKKFSQPEFLDDAKELVNGLKKLSVDEISKMSKTSGKLSQMNLERYKSFSVPFTEKNARPAIFAFMGDVYMGLDIHSFSAAELTYAQNHLLILSGLYGLLRPFDLMQPYRLEMGSKFANKRGKNLYEFWNGKITQKINDLAKKKKEKLLVNLASNEYFKAVQPKDLELEVITPVFKEKKFDEYVTVGMMAKKARGFMSKYILKNKVETVAALKKFKEFGYVFKKELSDEAKGQLVFTRG